MVNRLFIALTALSLLVAGCGKPDYNHPAPKPPVVEKASEPMVVYEVNPRLFKKGEALDGISDRLAEIKDLGVDVLWIMPVNEPGVLKSVNSPYCIKDFKKVNPDYGTLQDLKDLVSKAHGMGMKVILDWIANHTSWDNVWITEHKDWYVAGGNGEIISPPGFNWTDVAELNYNNKDMRAAMTDAIEYWVKEAGIDGYRFDHVDGVPADYWETVNEALKKLDPEVILLAESGNGGLSKHGFNAVYAWNFGSLVKKVFTGKAAISDLMIQYESENAAVEEGTRVLRYITNHDEASQASPVSEFRSREAALAGFVVTTLMTDTPLIYSSQEVGYDRALNFFNYMDFDWNADPGYTQAYKSYMKAYKASAELRCGDPLVYDTGEAISIWYAAENGRGFFAVVNSTGEDLAAKVPMARKGDKVRNLITGEEMTLGSTVDLGAYGYMIFEKM